MLVAARRRCQDNRSGYDSVLDEKDASGTEQIRSGKSPNGFLHGFTLANFVQYVEMDEKSWTLKIVSEEQSGFLHFREGILVDAQIEGKNGEEAALEILSWDQVDISVEGDCRVENSKVKRSLKFLLLEANRLMDEKE